MRRRAAGEDKPAGAAIPETARPDRAGPHRVGADAARPDVAGSDPAGQSPRTVDDPCAALTDDLPDGLVVADADGIVRLVNARAERIMGISREQACERPVTDVLPLRDDNGESWWDVVQPWAGLRTRTGHRERMLTLGTDLPVLVTMRYVRPDRDAPVSRVLISLREARGRQHADCADVIAVAAHELRGPLTSVRGFSTALLRQWDRFTDEQRQTMVSTVEADADRLGRLLLQLMDVTRLGTSRLTLDAREFDVRALVDDHLRRRIGAGADPDRFAWAESAESGCDVRLVRGDCDRIEQVVSNLIDNALKHGAGTITLSTDVDEPGMVGLSVADEGPGVDPAHYRDVFAKFWHGGRPGSTGLGLYLVKGLVEAHGGTVTVGPAREYPQPSGARFRFTLPAAC